MSADTHTLFVEIRTEELPPKLLNNLAHNFAKDLHAHLVKKEFISNADGFQYYATPRRLIALIANVSEAITKKEELRRGPSLKNSFDKNEEPSKALLGFLKSNNSSLEDIKTIEYRGEKYIAITQKSSTETLANNIANIIEKIITSTSAPRLMRWGDNDFRFVRPIKGIYIVHKQCIDTQVFNLPTEKFTTGHRFLSPDKFTLNNLDNITEEYQNNKIILDKELRKKEILSNLQKNNPSMDLDEDLLDEVVAMCEFPTVHLCEFDKKYLALPENVIKLCIKKHLKSFPVVVNNELLPSFYFVADNKFDDDKKLLAGLSRLINARLDDALFIFNLDKKLTEEEMVSNIKNINYMHGFGTIYDRMLRVTQISKSIGKIYKLKDAEIADLESASKLLKVDLCTETVNEYPQLEGHIASLLLTKQPNTVRELIDGHLNRELDNNENTLRDVLVLSMELEKIVVMAFSNKLPKGSGDPFAVRRSIGRIIKIAYRNPKLDITQLLLNVLSCFDKTENNNIIKDIKLQFIYRLNQNLSDLLELNININKKVINAILDPLISNCSNDSSLCIYNEVSKLITFNQFIIEKPQEFEQLLTLAKRIENISGSSKNINPELFDSEVEKEFYNSYLNIKKLIDAYLDNNEYQEVFSKLLELTPNINNYFDNVMVNVDNEEIRNNRKSMLGAINNLINCLANTKKLYS